MSFYLYPRQAIYRVSPSPMSSEGYLPEEAGRVDRISRIRTQERLLQQDPAYGYNEARSKPWQARKRFLLTGMAAFLFFLSMSGFALGILGVSQHLFQGVCTLSGGAILQVMAIYTAFLAGRK